MMSARIAFITTERQLLRKAQALVREQANTILERYKRSGGGLSGSVLGRKTDAPNGIYIYGAVGGGKTTLMDLFYECCSGISKKQRVHFNAFMTKVHKRIHNTKQKQAPASFDSDKSAPVANMIAAESWLICFDEFQVTDFADKMIWKRLFEHLWEDGVIVVATSNRHPTELNKNGLQRSNFLPFIDLLLEQCEVAELNNGIDYRRIAQSGDSNYIVTTKAVSQSCHTTGSVYFLTFCGTNVSCITKDNSSIHRLELIPHASPGIHAASVFFNVRRIATTEDYKAHMPSCPR